MKRRAHVVALLAAMLLLPFGARSFAGKPEKKPKPPPEPANPEIVAVDTRKAQIFVMDADGENRTTVLTLSALIYRPTLSPDGTQIAFETYASGQWGLRLADVETGDSTVLVADKAMNAFPAWSPDGDVIAYVYDQTEIRLISLDTGSEETVHRSVNGGDIHSLTFSPTGMKLAFTERLPAEVKVLDLSSGTATVLHTIVLGGDDRWEELDWARTDDVLALNHSGMISTYDMDTGVLTELVAGSNPAWSPDDGQLVFESGGVRVFDFATQTAQQIDRRGRWPDWRR